MVGEIDCFLDKAVDVNGPALSRALARVKEHVLDNEICTLAVLHDLIEIAPQCIGQLGNFCLPFP